MAPQPIHDHALEHVSEDHASHLRETLWWMQARRLIIRRYLEQASGLTAVSSIMDVGCGDGDKFDLLSGFGRVIGVEPSAKLVHRARGRKNAERVFESEWLELEGQFQIDLFTSFDVMEHCEDDHAFLAKFSQLVPESHLLLISVPACPFLYSEHDRLLHHYRRYSKKSLRETLSTSGYDIIRCDYFLSFMFPFAALSRLKEQANRALGRKQVEVNLGEMPPWLNRALLSIQRAEVRVSEHISFPIGLWLFALARHDPR